jgi:hypothetical protein
MGPSPLAPFFGRLSDLVGVNPSPPSAPISLKYFFKDDFGGRRTVYALLGTSFRQTLQHEMTTQSQHAETYFPREKKEHREGLKKITKTEEPVL